MITFKNNIVSANKLFSYFSHEVFFDTMIASAEIGSGNIVIATKYEFRQWLDNMVEAQISDIQKYGTDLELAVACTDTLFHLFEDIQAWNSLDDSVEYIIFDNGDYLVKK